MTKNRAEREREREREREEEAALKYIAIFSSVLFRGIAGEPMMLDTDAMRCDAMRCDGARVNGHASENALIVDSDSASRLYRATATPRSAG